MLWSDVIVWVLQQSLATAGRHGFEFTLATFGRSVGGM